MTQPEVESIKQQLQTMVEADQAVRQNKNATAADGLEVDARNTAQMKKWVEEYGGFKISDVGQEASVQAWLLLQHADADPEFQKYCLELMKALPEGEISKRSVAYLTDRVMVKSSGKQIYGTQFKDVGEAAYLRPMDDLDGLNARRAEMDLEPIEEYLKSAAEAFEIPTYLSEQSYLESKKLR